MVAGACGLVGLLGLVWVGERVGKEEEDMGNVSLGVGYVTKIWRVERSPAWDGASGVDEVQSGLTNGGIKQVDLVKRESSGGEDGISLRRKLRDEWCEIMQNCDSNKKLYHWILLRHYENGRVDIVVDGAHEGSGTASFSSCELKFRVGNQIAITRIGFNETKKFAYSFSTHILQPNGQKILLKELNHELIDNHDSSIVVGNVVSSEVVQNPKKPGETVAMYKVTSQVRNGGPVTVDKRFSQFVELDRLVRSAFSGSHLLSSIPPLPSKLPKTFVKHLSPDFIETRRFGLDTYLRKLLALPRIPQNPDVLEFLKILPPVAVSNAPPVVDV